MKDLAKLADASATPTMEAFADFLIAKVYGGTLPKGVDEKSFREGVRLGGSTRMDFQRSDEWKADARNYLANVDARKAEREAAKLEAAKRAAAKVAERIAKAEAALAALKAAASEDDADDADADADESDADESAA